MSIIYDKFLNFIKNDKLDLREIKSKCDMDTYFDNIESNILSDVLALTKNSKHVLYKDCIISSHDTITINEDISNMLNNVILINEKYYITSKCTKYTKFIGLTESTYYKIKIYPNIRIDDDNSLVNIYVIGYIGDKLHELSSLIHIQRNINDCKDILKSIINPLKYFDGDYCRNKSEQLNKCNEHQQTTIKSLKHNFEIIHGPPGTGKTTTIINILNERIPSTHSILCTAIQNQAIESLVMKLMTGKFSKSFAVFGDPSRLKKNSANYSIEKIYEHDDILIKINKKILKHNNKLELIKNKTYTESFYKMKKTEQKAYTDELIEKIEKYETKQMMRKTILLSNIKIYVSTIGSSHKIYNFINHNIDTIILDEAGATTEMQLFPLIRLNPKNMILIGDHKQLSAFAQHSISTDIYYNKSLLERMIDSKRKHHLLSQQYRMHNDICKLVSKLFYNKLLYSDESRIIESNKNIEWINVEHRDEQNGTSFYNKGEINEIVKLCDDYKKKNILILTFYNAQLDLLNSKFKNMNNVMCRSIDSCQGMESNIVIISLVRSGKLSNFMKDPKRICVMLSRAMDKIIIVGNSKQFYDIDIWKKIIDASHISYT